MVGDEMLALVENVIAPVGTEPCRWDDENEFEEVAQILNSCNCVASSGGLGLTAEFSFGDEENNVLGTSMLMIQTDQRHPQLGNGLLGRLHLPLPLDNRQTAQIAASLNRFETLSLTKSHLLGSWTLKEMGGCRRRYSSALCQTSYTREEFSLISSSHSRRGPDGQRKKSNPIPRHAMSRLCYASDWPGLKIAAVTE